MTQTIDKRLFGAAGGWIPEVNPQIRYDNAVRSPEWMVAIAGTTTAASTITGYIDYTELFGWTADSARETRGFTGNQLYTSGALQHSDVMIEIPNGGFSPTLEINMNNGVQIATITLVRLAHIDQASTTGNIVPLQEIVFTNCLIQALQQRLDRLIVTFRFSKRQNTVYQYGQNGVLVGRTASVTDYSLNTSGAPEES